MIIMVPWLVQKSFVSCPTNQGTIHVSWWIPILNEFSDGYPGHQQIWISAISHGLFPIPMIFPWNPTIWWDNHRTKITRFMVDFIPFFPIDISWSSQFLWYSHYNPFIRMVNPHVTPIFDSWWVSHRLTRPKSTWRVTKCCSSCRFRGFDVKPGFTKIQMVDLP